jgi:Fic family protein
MDEDDAANDTFIGVDAVNDTLDDAANDTLNEVDAVNDTLNDAANDTLNRVDAVNDRIKTVTEQWSLKNYKKPVREKIIMLSVLLYQQEGLKAEELAIMLQLKLQAVKRYLKILKEREIIERPHPKKEGGYYLTQSFRKEIENNKI